MLGSEGGVLPRRRRGVAEWLTIATTSPRAARYAPNLRVAGTVATGPVREDDEPVTQAVVHRGCVRVEREVGGQKDCPPSAPTGRFEVIERRRASGSS